MHGLFVPTQMLGSQSLLYGIKFVANVLFCCLLSEKKKWHNFRFIIVSGSLIGGDWKRQQGKPCFDSKHRKQNSSIGK